MIRGRYVLTTANGALTMAVVVANMPWFLGRSPKLDVAELRKARLIKLDGNSKEVCGQELWQERGAVIMIVR